MNGIKLILITVEISALLVVVLLQLIETTASKELTGFITIMSSVLAVMLQAEQDQLNWNIKSENE